MPAIENWMTCPLAIIQRLFGESAEKHETRVKEYFLPKILEAKATHRLPSLNDVATHNIPTNSVVQFRAMVQDMHDPEFYLGAYEVENLKTGVKSLKCGKFRDVAECAPNEEIRLESAQNKTLDRQTLYCIPIPGETTWLKQLYAQQSGTNTDTPGTSVVPERMKRSLDDDEQQPANGGPVSTDSMETESLATDSSDNKKSKTETSTGKSSSEPFDLNLPLPGSRGPCCFVKLYEAGETLKLNDMIEVVGVLSNDPAMASFADNRGEKSAFMSGDSELMEGLEDDDTTPPPSLIPRLHAITVCKLDHCNPLLTAGLQETILSEAESLRNQLLSILTKLLFGDNLAAEYLLCHLISTIYARQDVVALGKFALNLSGCPKSGSFPKLLHGFLQELVAKCSLLPMSLDNMNKMAFVPKKDYKANRLKTGILQLSTRTHVILDETALQPGQLDVNGVSNITALGNVITWQKVDYDFNFHKQEFPCDLIVLVVSEGKSILKCDCRIPLVATQGGIPDNLAGHFQRVCEQELSSLDVVNKLRQYIGLVQTLTYELPADIQKEVEQDFVDMRKEDKSNLSVEDFHSLLVLARLLSLTRGEQQLTREIWEGAKILEVQRKTRLVLTSHEQK